jgi:phospholipid:diacylglycerol acyltransferase
MSFLRRRIWGSSSSPTSQEDSSPAPEKLKLVPVSKIKTNRKKRNGLIFGLGGLFGILVAAFFAEKNDVLSLDTLSELNLDSLIDVIPSGIIKDARELTVRAYSICVCCLIY